MKNIQINEQERKRILGMHKSQLNEQMVGGSSGSPKENVRSVFNFCIRNWAGVDEKYGKKMQPSFDQEQAVRELKDLPQTPSAQGGKNAVYSVIENNSKVFSTLPDVCRLSSGFFDNNLFDYIDDRAMYDNSVWTLLNSLLTKGGAFADMNEFVPELNQLRAKMGSPTNYVRQIQEKLKELGYQLTADNSLGPKTFAALSEVLSNPCNKKVSIKDIKMTRPTDDTDDDFDRPM
jgi:hypothetical protein